MPLQENDLLPPDDHNSQELREARALLLEVCTSEESEPDSDSVRRSSHQAQPPTSAEKHDQREYRWRKVGRTRITPQSKNRHHNPIEL